MMTVCLCLKNINTQDSSFDLEKLKDPNVLETFQAVIGGKSALLTIMNNEDADMDSMITTFNIAVTKTASEITCNL